MLGTLDANKNYYQCIDLKLLYKGLTMKKSIRTLLFLSLLVIQIQSVFAIDIFAPLISEMWECNSEIETDRNLNIVVDSINLISTGLYEGVDLNSEGEDIHSLSGAYLGADHKEYSINLYPSKTINYFKGARELTIDGKAIVHYDQHSECLGGSQGKVVYNCSVRLKR